MSSITISTFVNSYLNISMLLLLLEYFPIDVKLFVNTPPIELQKCRRSNRTLHPAVYLAKK
jgi:hypothetical protein